MPSRPSRPHSENLSRMEVSQPLPAAEEQSDSGGGVVPSLCGESLYRCGPVVSEGQFKEKAVANYRFNRKPGQLFSPLLPFFFFFQQQTKYQKIKRATTLVQSYTRGWQVSGFIFTKSDSATRNEC